MAQSFFNIMNKEIMKQMGFKKEVELIEQGKCPACKKEIKRSEFQDDLSRKEYKISGLCQRCQDNIFN